MKRLPSKLLTFLITILLITFIAFALLRLASSDPAEIQLARTGVTYTAERLEALRRELGLDAPFLLQYFRWLGGLVQGDLGLSMSTGLPVASQLFSALPNTLLLSGITLAISAVVSLALGILCALRQGSLFDRFVMALTNALAALPGYFISLVLLYVFALKLRLFSVLITSVTLKSLILPAAALSIGLIPPYVKGSKGKPDLFLSSAEKQRAAAFEYGRNFPERNAGRLHHHRVHFWLAGAGPFGHERCL